MLKKLLLLLFMVTSVTAINAQKLRKKQQTKGGKLAGLWSLVAVENVNPDGTKTLPYGSNPKGMMVLDPAGIYAIQILKAGRPKVVAGDKNQATPVENAALVQGNNSHFGHYEVNEAQNSITFKVEHAFYPNWEETVQKRQYTLNGDELKYIVTQTTNGGAVTAAVVWKRQK